MRGRGEVRLVPLEQMYTELDEATASRQRQTVRARLLDTVTRGYAQVPEEEVRCPQLPPSLRIEPFESSALSFSPADFPHGLLRERTLGRAQAGELSAEMTRLYELPDQGLVVLLEKDYVTARSQKPR